jgi:Dyp-type peroxidase family
MAIDLTKPLAWTNAKPQEKKMLADLQGNILKGHGRDHTTNLVLRFDPSKKAAARTFIQKVVAPLVTDAAKQLKQGQIFKKTGKPGDVFVGFFLSVTGYQVLGIPASKTPTDPAFVAGLKARTGTLNDPAPAKWDAAFQGEVHAMILIADDLQARVNNVRANIEAKVPAGVTVIGREDGAAMRNANGDGIEHFGYVDGRSQPLLLKEDIKHEKDKMGGIDKWDPAFGIGTALVPCPGAASDTSFGSYFVFRKLEQDVRGFKTAEKQLATILGLNAADEERAGAMVVGRFEDGTPLVMQGTDGLHSPVRNNFNFSGDPAGSKCPFHAHIRKSNPRGESVGPFASNVAEERTHIMARRGITYGHRGVHPNDPILDEHPELMPADGVGLLFMAYQNDIGNQFEFTQKNWVNNPNFVKPATGIDPVIGQGAGAAQKWPVNYGGSSTKASLFSGFVRMKGGEYFFAPCISFLKNLP